MEETWELAVVNDGGGVAYYGFSGRHVRVKYQAVLASIGVCCIAFLETKSVSIPGFIEFSGMPAEWVLEFLAVCFAVFSIVAFWSQTKLERKFIPYTPMLFRNVVKSHKKKLLPEIKKFDGESFDAAKEAIVNEVEDYSKDLVATNDFVMKWQPIANTFYNVQTEVGFSLTQLNNFEAEVREDIYRGSHNYDSHYKTSLQTFHDYLEELIGMLWRPNDFIEKKGRLEFNSVISNNLIMLRRLSETIPKQCSKLLEDLEDHLKSRNFNQETLSVQVPYGISIGLTFLGTSNILLGYVKALLCPL